MLEFEDILYSKAGGVATIAINRPDKMNSVTGDTLQEIEAAFEDAGADPAVAGGRLTGVGEEGVLHRRRCHLAKSGERWGEPARPPLHRRTRPWCDARSRSSRASTATPSAAGTIFAYFCDFHDLGRSCRLRAKRAALSPIPPGGPVVNYLTRIVGHKRAREMWMLGRRYPAAQMLDWGLVNAVVPMAELDANRARWCDELLAVSPTCLKVYKASFIEEFEDLLGQGDFLKRWLVGQEFWETEQKEGTTAFMEKAKADFSRFPDGSEGASEPSRGGDGVAGETRCLPTQFMSEREPAGAAPSRGSSPLVDSRTVAWGRIIAACSHLCLRPGILRLSYRKHANSKAKRVVGPGRSAKA